MTIVTHCARAPRSLLARLALFAGWAMAAVAVGATCRAAEPPPEVRIVTLGDSITKGVRTGVAAEETFAALLQAGLKERGIAAAVINVGVGGERVDGALARLDDVLEHKPHFVTIMYGTNDSYVDVGATKSRVTEDEYAKNLKTLLEKLRAAGVTPILMTEPCWAKGATNGLNEDPNVRLAKYMDACRQTAKETKTPLVDHFAHWRKAAKERDIESWTTDKCHPNPAGHRVLADLMLPAVVQAIQNAAAQEK